MNLPSYIRGVRGATTVAENTADQIRAEAARLLETVCKDNGIAEDDIVCVFFTVTPDVSAVSPAQVARTRLGWHTVPLFCAAEPFVEGLPSRCIRILILFYTTMPKDAIRHVYLNEAVTLRPDLAASPIENLLEP